jgi:hypothetical protein
MKNTQQMKGEPVQEKIFGQYIKDQNPEYKLFAIFWRRIANSGLILCWAKDATDAVQKYGYNQKFILHTVFEIDPSNMPVQYGKEEF